MANRTWFEHTGSRHTYKVKHEVFVVAAEVKTLGDTPLVEHDVRILDADTGEAVGDVHKTDDKGVVRVEVPKKKKYRIEIVDAPLTVDEPPRPEPELPSAVLVCEFLDETGKPVGGEEVEIKAHDTGGGTAMTDDHGRIEAPALLGPCELKIRDQTFIAHALPLADAEEPSNCYRFIVEKKKS
jgi:hypothetical protein